MPESTDALMADLQANYQIGISDILALVGLAQKIWELVKPFFNKSGLSLDIQTLSKKAEQAVEILKALMPQIQALVDAVTKAWPQIVALFNSTGSAPLGATA